MIKHAYRNACSVSIIDNGINYIVGHSVKYDAYEQYNVCNVDYIKKGYVVSIKNISSYDDLKDLSEQLPYRVFQWMHNRLFPESIVLGEVLSKRLHKQAKLILEYSEAQHVVYGVCRELNGQLRTFFKPCSDLTLVQHELLTRGYIYAVHA